ncbi:hypothetical protein CW748_09720 [Alteromonadales bacterium alter-6D02]|nr:hypothetical protein CW748_09720 [Alteromonadales bacterium alter-6D02]
MSPTEQLIHNKKLKGDAKKRRTLAWRYMPRGLMHSTLNQWLRELEIETQIVHSTDINEEANSNMVTFGTNESLLQDWGKDSIKAFVLECAELYNLKNTVAPMTFYSWYDEMAGQIRISAVSACHGKLPFRCNVNQVGLGAFIESFYTQSSIEPYTLNVWLKGI